MNTIVRIEPRALELGSGFVVNRTLPSRHKRMIGPWCFLDHAGPVQFQPGQGMHVGAHPHIGLQTFTWMLEGEVQHRDSLGNDCVIRPGEVNLMTAGHGIVHTEDTVRDGERLHAAQLWIALPEKDQDCAPGFAHYTALPQWQVGHITCTLLAGTHENHTAPTQIFSPLIGMDVRSDKGGQIKLTLNPAFEYGVVALTGTVSVQGQTLATDELAWVQTGEDTLTLELSEDSTVLVVGGEPFDPPVTLWWNFVGFSRQRIAQAQTDWENGHPRFGVVHSPGERRLVAPTLPAQFA